MIDQPQIKLPLTGPQAAILSVIGEFLQTRYYPPTIAEIQAKLDIANPGTIHKALSSLEKKEYIRKAKNVARGIRLTPLGSEVCAAERQLNLELHTLKQIQNPHPK
ncbi:MAG: hypothetical protein P9M08_11585 [Candidatus Erginobacter occultus]|nr:hypothetical protein [Candidatus Erginobacter occultus]